MKKIDLFKECIKSLGIAMGSRAITMEVLLDSCPIDYEIVLQDIPLTTKVNVHHFQSLGNIGSFEKQLEIALELEDETIVLIIEDDYYWAPEGFDAIIEFLQNAPTPCFATPYNHPDYSNLPIHKERLGPNSEWRSGISTTCTFGARAGTIKTRIRILNQYRTINDFGMWLCLTRVGLYPSSRLLKRSSTQRELGVFKDWLKALLTFIFLRLWRVPITPLFYPINSGATHMDSNFIGLGRKWPF